VQVTVTLLAAMRKKSSRLLSLQQQDRHQYRTIFNANVH